VLEGSLDPGACPGLRSGVRRGDDIEGLLRHALRKVVQPFQIKEEDGKRRHFMFKNLKIGFIGGGNMGEAMIRGLISASLFTPDQIHAFDVSTQRMQLLTSTYGVQASPDLGHLAASSQLIVLAVKPQVMQTVLNELRSHLSHQPLVISIAAGIPIANLVQGLAAGTHIIRVMPNTPALVLEGASALARGPGVTDDEMAKALSLFRAVGKASEVDESLMDAVTGLSGSGPGYILLVLESLIDAGVLMGIPRQTARELVLQTALGTAKMASETGKHPAELKDLITSPGGTTIRGLRVLEDRGVRGAILSAVEAATLRSMELGGKK
jgi:pyrroline-5-carboxylate reductase